jgi:hypothetical protein
MSTTFFQPMSNTNRQANTQKVGEVLKTYDLSIFKQLPGNRPPNLLHIKRLRQSMIDHGVLMCPIIVNENMEVIDGQHRLLAAQGLDGVPIYYIKAENYRLEQVHTLNMNQKNWSKKDFVDGYAEMGLEAYIKLKRFIEVNKDFVFDSCIHLVNQNASISHFLRDKNNAIENGTFKGKDFDYAYQLAEQIRRCGKYFDNYVSKGFVVSIVQAVRNDKFDMEVFLHKLQYNYDLLDKCRKVHHYKDVIEKIYNYKNQNKISLFI